MRRSTTSKYKQLTALKVAARENGWTPKVKAQGTDHAERKDDDEDDACFDGYTFQSFGDFYLVVSTFGVFKQLTDFKINSSQKLCQSPLVFEIFQLH